MKKIKWAYLALMIGLTGLWLVVDTLFATPIEFLPLRKVFINYTGLIGIGVMSAGMILSMRPVALEPWLGGLDKMYRLHKWLGITGLVFSVLHWILSNSPKWLVGLGLMARRERRPPPPPGQTDTIAGFLQAQKHLAESVGEWAFYIAVLLIAIALIKRFPYRNFRSTHHLLAAVYLALVFHTIVLFPFSQWSTVLGPVLAVLMIAGTIAALISLFRKVGFTRQSVGVVEELVRHPESQVLKVGIKLKNRWLGHSAGQFAFVTFDHSSEPHPFTISSSWADDGYMFFLIKEIGDFTRTLAAKLKTGDVVKVEGPYGRFTFKSPKTHQIWVAGGIGITPFIARMQALIAEPDDKVIDLFYSTRALESEALAMLQRDADASKVRLHLFIDAKDGRLTADRICEMAPEWPAADFWFCGPAGFGQALRKDFIEKGLSPDDYHQELFEMR